MAVKIPMNDNEIQNVPFIVYESSQASSERVIKRLVVALIVTIILMFLSNAIWLWAWMQYDYVYEGESIDVDATEIVNLIDEWILNERDRAILKRRLLDGICFGPLAEEFGLSVRQVKNIVYKAEKKLFRHF